MGIVLYASGWLFLLNVQIHTLIFADSKTLRFLLSLSGNESIDSISVCAKNNFLFPNALSSAKIEFWVIIETIPLSLAIFIARG